jgi:hypothetical protein
MTRHPAFLLALLTALLLLPSCKALLLEDDYTLDNGGTGADGDTDADTDTGTDGDTDTDTDTDTDADADADADEESGIHPCTQNGQCASNTCLLDGYCAVFCNSSSECGIASNGFSAYCAPEAITGRNACFPGCQTAADCASYADGVDCILYAEMGDVLNPQYMCFVPAK